MPDTQFLFVVCQQGAEQALKDELASQHPELRFAYSRPGFVTFKNVGDDQLPDDFLLRSTFARAYGFSVGKAAGETPEERAADVYRQFTAGRFPHLHVWQRDLAPAGHRGYEPGISPLAKEVVQLIDRCQADESPKRPINQLAQPNQKVFDCVIVEPDQWWLGYHLANMRHHRSPGGLYPIEPPEQVVSRAYCKMAEALDWSQFPVRPGDRWVEIGSSPGGASQLLLDCEMQVIGIDPAEMDATVLAHPDFTHIRKRGADVRRRDFRDVRWLAADLNVAPTYTLDTVEAIVTYPEVNIRGLLLILKLLDWTLAASIPEYLERIRAWGYDYVRPRQLSFNRQEICVAAMRSRSQTRHR